jgi:hypothetical protein
MQKLVVLALVIAAIAGCSYSQNDVIKWADAKGLKILDIYGTMYVVSDGESVGLIVIADLPDKSAKLDATIIKWYNPKSSAAYTNNFGTGQAER